jgi:hypothetical protein
VAGGRDGAAVRVEEVHAGDLARDGDPGFARQRVKDRVELERDVQCLGRPRQRAVAVGLSDAPLLSLEASEPERRLVGEGLGDHDVVGGPLARCDRREHGDVADVAGPAERQEQGPARLQPLAQLGAELGGGLDLVERDGPRAGGHLGDPRGQRRRLRGRREAGRLRASCDHRDGIGGEGAARLLLERLEQLPLGVRRQGDRGKAEQGGVGGVGARTKSGGVGHARPTAGRSLLVSARRTGP